MILTTDLIKWAKENAIGQSTTHWFGYISAEMLEELAKKIKEKEPFNYNLEGK